MNYFIQGDAANAGKIKAAFEKLGYEKVNVIHIGDYANERLFFFTENGKVRSTLKDCGIVHIIKTHPDYQELELPTKPNFKAGDWVVTDYGKVSQVVSVDNAGDGYTLDDGVYFSGSWCDMYHLWTIADAKDGDILSAKIDGDDYILIFKQIKDGWIETYGHYYITIDKFCAPTQMFCRNYQGRLYPATKEQYRTLFKKMHDDGYEWDFDKKELKKIPVKPKFKVGDWLFHKSYGVHPILVKDYSETQGYKVECISSTYYIQKGVVENEYHPWTIQDATGGDVLVDEATNTIGIFEKTYGICWHSKIYCAKSTYNTMVYGGSHQIKFTKPATKEQRDQLFAKIKEAGYQWDEKKMELYKIKHYDIANFKPKQWVLVRDCNNQVWGLSMFSHRDMGCYICLNREDFTQCIPFEGNERLLGTTDMPSVEYINW